jgi:RNA polymerase sigma-70 factor (ECF subfamily)
VPLTYEELIARVLATDDRAAFGVLVERYQSPVRRFLRQLAKGNEASADDLAQDTFIQAYRSLRQFRGGARFPTWLLGIAHNHHRNARRRERTAAEAAPALSVPEAVESGTRLADLQHDLGHALGRLTTDEQAAVHLHYHQGLSHQDIATVLECPVGTVKTNLARSKDKLRPLLAAWNHQT